MLSVSNDYDVFVTATGAEASREAALVRLIQLHPLDSAAERALLAGDRVLLRGKLSDSEAQRTATGLRALGLRVEIEAHSGPLAMAELDSFTNDEPRAAAKAAPENLLFDVGAGLVGLDGNEEDLVPAAKPAPGTRAGGGDALGGLMSISLSDVDEPLAPEPGKPRAAPPRAVPPPPPASRPAPPAIPIARPAPPRPATPAARPAPSSPAPQADDRFAPIGLDRSSASLALDVVPPDPMMSQTTPREDVVEAPRCPTHGLAKVRGRCAKCAVEEREVQGRFLHGKLRGNPALRVGLGVGLGVLLGWIITAPMARKGEREVTYTREEADRERARPTEEAQGHAKALDEQADGAAQAAFIRTFGVWALIAAVTTGVWYRLT